MQQKRKRIEKHRRDDTMDDPDFPSEKDLDFSIEKYKPSKEKLALEQYVRKVSVVSDEALRTRIR